MHSPFLPVLLNLSFRRFLVDSDVSVSVFTSLPSTSDSSEQLVTADRSSLTCSDSRIIPLCFGSHRFDWPFQLALVALPILGSDFLCHHRLLLDVSNQCVFCPVSPGSPEISLASSAPSLTSCLRPPPFYLLHSASPTSSLSFYMFSLPMGSLPPNHAIRSDTFG